MFRHRNHNRPLVHAAAASALCLFALATGKYLPEGWAAALLLAGVACGCITPTTQSPAKSPAKPRNQSASSYQKHSAIDSSHT